jgi:hypothetical protein
MLNLLFIINLTIHAHAVRYINLRKLHNSLSLNYYKVGIHKNNNHIIKY